MEKIKPEDVQISVDDHGHVEIGLPDKWQLVTMSRGPKNTWIIVKKQED